MRPVYIATAYLGPIQQYCKMLQYPEVRIETAENYVKQTYRNRCVIATPPSIHESYAETLRKS